MTTRMRNAHIRHVTSSHIRVCSAVLSRNIYPCYQFALHFRTRLSLADAMETVLIVTLALTRRASQTFIMYACTVSSWLLSLSVYEHFEQTALFVSVSVSPRVDTTSTPRIRFPPAPHASHEARRAWCVGDAVLRWRVAEWRHVLWGTTSTHTHTQTHTHTHTDTHSHTHTHSSTHTDTHKHTHTHAPHTQAHTHTMHSTHTHTYTHHALNTHTHTSTLQTSTHTYHTHKHTHTHTLHKHTHTHTLHTSAHTHTDLHLYTLTHSHSHTHIHTHAHRQSPPRPIHTGC